MPLSPYLRSALLNATLRNQSYTSPSTVWMALWTGDPAAFGTEIPVPRQQVFFTAQGLNNAPVTFPSMPTNTVVYVAIHDSQTGGNLLAYGALATPTPVQAGDVFVVGTQNFSVALT